MMYIDDKLRARARKQAKKERRTLAALIRFVLEQYINDRK